MLNARNRIGKNGHDFEYINQMFEGLFNELIENIQKLTDMPANTTDKEFINLHNAASPAQFLTDRKMKYDNDTHIIMSRREDLNKVLMFIADTLGLYSLQLPDSNKAKSRG